MMRPPPFLAGIRCRLVAAVLTWPLVVPPAAAIVLGELRSSSRVGQILDVEIDIDVAPDERFEAGCLKLFRPPQSSDAVPWLTDARLRYHRESGRGTLRIVSAAPLGEMAVQLAVRAECGDRAARQYMVLLDAPLAAAASATADSARRPAADRAETRVTAAERRLRQGAPTSVGQRRAGTPPADRGIALRLSDRLSAPAASSEFSRELLRLEQRTLQMVNIRHDDRQGLGEKLAWLEADLAELQRAKDRLAAAALELSAPGPNDPAGRAGGLAALPKVTSTPPAAAISSPPLDTGEPPSPTRPPAPASAESGRWTVYMALAASLLLLPAWLFHRRRAPRRELRVPRPASVRQHPPLVPAPSPTAARRAVAPPATPFHPARTPMATPSAAAAPPDLRQTDANPALELAEVMISFGRVRGAAKTLEGYLAINPKESLRPWIRLLQIYQRNAMRSEFEAMGLKLNQSFNVEIPRWDSGSEADRTLPGEPLASLPVEPHRERPTTLEDIPRIRNAITSLWGKPQCSDHLERLLRDNRDGRRRGFPLPIIEELLFLIDLMAARLAADQFH